MLIDQGNVKRLVAEYCNESNLLLSEYELSSFDLEKFQEVFDVASDNPMFDCWEITHRHVEFVSQYSEEQISWNFSNNAYFLEAHNHTNKVVKSASSKANNGFLLSVTGLGESEETDISERDEEILSKEIDSIKVWSLHTEESA